MAWGCPTSTSRWLHRGQVLTSTEAWELRGGPAPAFSSRDAHSLLQPCRSLGCLCPSALEEPLLSLSGGTVSSRCEQKNMTCLVVPHSLVSRPHLCPTSQKATATPPSAFLCAFDASVPSLGSGRSPQAGSHRHRAPGMDAVLSVFFWCRSYPSSQGPGLVGCGHLSGAQASPRPSFLFHSWNVPLLDALQLEPLAPKGSVASAAPKASSGDGPCHHQDPGQCLLPKQVDFGFRLDGFGQAVCVTVQRCVHVGFHMEDGVLGSF